MSCNYYLGETKLIFRLSSFFWKYDAGDRSLFLFATRILEIEKLETKEESSEKKIYSYNEILKHLQYECPNIKIHTCPQKCDNQTNMCIGEIKTHIETFKIWNVFSTF